jgi:UDP-2,3-diacylglucosamine pyrophosphatase LpxH
MFLDRKIVWDKLSALWDDSQILRLDTLENKYVIFSDTHFGDGGEADDFYNNRLALINALDYYRNLDYSLILLGDIEEFWQFDLDKIVIHYDEIIYSKVRGFGDERVVRVYGNHDYEWGGFVDPTKVESQKLNLAHEAIKMNDRAGEARILLVHGHQGTIDSDKYAWFSRFFVRIFKRIEPIAKFIGAYGQTSATKSRIAKDYERTLYQWAKKEKVILICGHSHRAIFASKSYAEKIREEITGLKSKSYFWMPGRSENLRKIAELEMQLEDEKEKGRMIEPTDPGKDPLPCYFNTGCGLYTDGITAIEIDDDEIRLVKWNRDTISPPSYEVYERGRLSKFIKAVSG